jgi:hypothetical protein
MKLNSIIEQIRQPTPNLLDQLGAPARKRGETSGRVKGIAGFRRSSAERGLDKAFGVMLKTDRQGKCPANEMTPRRGML